MMEMEVPTRAWASYQTTVDNKPSEQWKAEEKGARQQTGRFVEDSSKANAAEKGALARTESD